MSGIEVVRLANRAAFPAVAAIVDEFRAAFGAGVRVLGGVEFGTGKSFGVLTEHWAGCDGCEGRRVCDHPDRATSFCGFRRVDEQVYLVRQWAAADFKRMPRMGGAR